MVKRFYVLYGHPSQGGMLMMGNRVYKSLWLDWWPCPNLDIQTETYTVILYFDHGISGERHKIVTGYTIIQIHYNYNHSQKVEVALCQWEISHMNSYDDYTLVDFLGQGRLLEGNQADIPSGYTCHVSKLLMVWFQKSLPFFTAIFFCCIARTSTRRWKLSTRSARIQGDLAIKSETWCFGKTSFNNCTLDFRLAALSPRISGRRVITRTIWSLFNPRSLSHLNLGFILRSRLYPKICGLIASVLATSDLLSPNSKSHCTFGSKLFSMLQPRTCGKTERSFPTWSLLKPSLKSHRTVGFKFFSILYPQTRGNDETSLAIWALSRPSSNSQCTVGFNFWSMLPLRFWGDLHLEIAFATWDLAKPISHSCDIEGSRCRSIEHEKATSFCSSFSMLVVQKPLELK